MSRLNSLSSCSAAAGLSRASGSVIELAGLRLSPQERRLYEDVRGELKRERIQGLGPHVRPPPKSSSTFTTLPFEQRRAWAGRRMLLPRMGGAAAKLRYYKAACEVRHPLQTADVKLPTDLLAAVRFVAGKGGRVVADRDRRLAVLRHCALRLEPLHARLCALMPAHVRVISAPMNLALVACCVDALPGYPDRYLVHRFVHGFEVCGPVADSGCFRSLAAADAPPYTPVEGVFNPASNLAWIGELEATMKAQGNKPGHRPTPAAEAAYAATLKECAGSAPTTWGVELSSAERRRTGRTHRGLTAEEVDAHPWITGGKAYKAASSRASGLWRPMRRFAIWQNGKWRACDHARESLHNACTKPAEALAGQATAELPSQLARGFAEAHGEPVAMEGGTEDWPRAYRKSPVSSPRFNVVCVWNPHCGCPEYFLLAGFNFGLVSAVCGFNRWPFFVMASARAWLGCCAGSYFDDAFTGEPAYARGSGQAALWAWAELTGLPFALDKHVPPNSKPKFVGVVTDYSLIVSRGELLVSVDPSRRTSVYELVDAALAADRLSRTQAAKLSGKLRWTLCPCFGRVGLALLQPLHAVRSVVCPLPDDLREALTGLRMLAELMPPRSVQVMASREPPTVIFTDASYENGAGALGVVIKRPGLPLLWTACDCPEWVLDAFREVDRHKKQYIGQLELLAAVVAYTTFPEELRGRHVVHWVDNESAVYGLVKGYSGSPDSARVINLYHACITQLGVTPWVEYVHTDDNLADDPSRGEFSLLLVLGGSGSYRAAVVPPVRSLTGPLLPLLAAAPPL